MKRLGLDVGIASVGWFVIDTDKQEVVDGGVYLFEPPETRNSSGKGEANRKRDGDMRRAKRQTRRRRDRLSRVRRLLHEAGVLPDASRHAIRDATRRIARDRSNGTSSPWRLRAEGLDRCLTADEWAVVVAHLAGHRAYFSNAKKSNDESSRTNKPTEKEEGQVSEALRKNDLLFTRAATEGAVETVGEWLSAGDRQRNRLGDYRFSIRREWVKDEANLLFARQRNTGNPAADAEFQQRYNEIAFEQLPVKAIKALGVCTFEVDQKRAPRHCFSFERFRLLARLHNLKIVSDTNANAQRRLSADQIRAVLDAAQKQSSVTYAMMHRELKLAKSERFDGVPDKAAAAKDVFDRKGARTLPGTEALRKVVCSFDPVLWDELQEQRDKLDGIAIAIAHHDDLEEIERGLSSLDLKPELVALLKKEADGGQLGFFKGTGHLSIDALRKIEPLLIGGLDLHNSLTELAKNDVRYDPTRDRFSRKPGISGVGPAAVRVWLGTQQLETLITSQTAARAIRETLKQALVIVEAHPDISAIHLEMAREVGKSPDARQETELEQKARQRQREGLRRDFEETFRRPATESEESRWSLWKQQQGKCAFSGENMSSDWVIDGDGRVQIEHILPRSRFRNDSLDNQILCLTSTNQNKGNKTPYEWLKDGNERITWDTFSTRAKAMFKGRVFERKIKNLLVVDSSRLELSFKNRDLVDTRWIAKFLLFGLERIGTSEAPIRVQPVNAGLVGMLRHAWGFSAWKRDPGDKSKRRADDRHHALDAAIVATVDHMLVGRLTIAHQKAEMLKREFPARSFDPPWRDFRRDVLDQIYGSGATSIGPERYLASDRSGIFVVRAESRRARGPVHKDTTYGIRPKNGSTVSVERLQLKDLEPEHLDHIRYGKYPERLRQKLEDWLALSKPTASPPTLPYRDDRTGEMVERPIRRVTIESRHKPAVRVRMSDHGQLTPDSSMAREGIIRVDLFSSTNGSVLCLPIYRVHLQLPEAPAMFFAGGEELPLPSDAVFKMSVFPNNYICVVTTDKTVVEGYYRRFDRDSGRLELWPHFTLDAKARRRVSVGKILKIEKAVLNRFGLVEDRNGHPVTVTSEKRTWRPPVKLKVPRTWRGAVCT